MQKVRSIIRFRAPAGEGGFSVVEVLLAATVFGMLTTGVIGAIVYGRASSADSGDTVRAHMIAEEGLAAVRNIADASYASLVDGSYGLTQTGSPLSWSFLGSGTTDTTNIYTRQITIATAGTNRKTVTSTVTWPQVSGGTGTVSVVHRITNWPATLKLWSAAVVGGSNDITSTSDGLKTATQGNYAYTVRNVVTTSNFVVTNITNPAAPTSAVFSIAGTPTNIFVSGNYAYVTNQLDTAELQVVNITNPAAPSVVASVDMPGTGNGLGVYVANGYAYVTRVSDATTNANELTILNVGTPAAPTVVGGYNNAINITEVTVIGTNAFVSTNSTTQEMLVINCAVPAAPVLLATYNPTTPNLAANTIASFGNTIFLGMSTTLDVVDVTTPTTPTRKGTFTAAGTINDIAADITGTQVFLGTTSTTGEVQVVNVTTLTAPVLSKTVDVTGTTSTVNGVAYSTSLDVMVGASASDTQEIIVVNRN
jgi:Tfp pilus assembly protein PilV